MIDTRFSVSIQIMMTVANHKHEMVTSELLAGALDTNATFIRKIVSTLVEAGLLNSYRGKGGGIELAKRPTEISLSEIYLASTNDKKLINVHNKPVMKSCDVSCCIKTVLNDLVDGIENSTQTYLSKKTLQDLMRKV
jgi:Rrf2 family protein